jgi:hypothetical protein
MRKWTCRPERFVSLAGGGGGGGGCDVVETIAGIALTAVLSIVLLQSAPFSMQAGLTLSVDTVACLPPTRSCSVICLEALLREFNFAGLAR